MSRAPSVTALRGPAAPPGGGGGRSAPTPPGAGYVAAHPVDERLLHPLGARALAFFALAAFGAAHWMQMVDPVASQRAWYAVGAAAASTLALVAAARLTRPARQAAMALAVLGGTALALLGAGLADEFLRPGQWDELASGISRGLDALPGARVPYRGLDEWLRLVIPLGGTALCVLAALLAFWPWRSRGAWRPAAPDVPWPGVGSHPPPRDVPAGFPLLALVALVTLYAVPAVALYFDQEFLRGAALALLVIAFLRLERLRRRDALAAVATGGAAAVLALAVAPAIDGVDPWWDYETWALSAAGSRSTTFAWDHEYGPLQWPRDGRDLLRVKSPRRAYWKADQLDLFDGERWQRTNLADGGRTSPEVVFDGVEPRNFARWLTTISVSVRNLRSESFVTAGSTEAIHMPGRPPRHTERLGIFTTSRTLRRGDAYQATVYLPTPIPREMRAAGTNDLGFEMQPFRRIVVPTGGLGEATPVVFPAFKADPVPSFGGDGSEVLESSGLARTWELARQLRRGARTPYDYVRRVERHLGTGFTYSERPPEESATLDGFLFDSRVGYCQQYSGAMALLLRMGGVPARIAVGFSPGSYNRKTDEYVVRDYDAHSWVEAWFPGIGWVPFDPTPTSAPPRSQADSALAPSAALGDVRDLGTATLDPRRGQVDEPTPWAAIVGGVAGAVALAFLTRALVRRRRRHAARPAVLELERALRIAGDGLTPSTTIAALEARFAASGAAVGYLRALRDQRYAAAANGPTPAQRRGLRRALAHGRGLAGRLRGYWALPPKLPPRTRL